LLFIIRGTFAAIMPTLAIILLLASASLHALWNLILKRANEKYIAMGWQVIVGGIFAFIILIFTGLPPRSTLPFLLASVLLETIYFILLSNAYTDHDFSLVYPIARGTAPAILLVWSLLLMKEKTNTGGILGIGLIVCGMVIIGATSLFQNPGSKLHIKGILTALSVAVMISLYTFVDGFAVKNTSPLTYGLTMFALVPIPTTIFNLRKYGWDKFSSTWHASRLTLSLAAVLGIFSYLFALFAYSFAPISYSGAIREVSVIIGAFLGWKFLGENMGGTRVLGAIIIFTGILIITILG
jgi:drug/metabolite transporter (DMT)-like permease